MILAQAARTLPDHWQAGYGYRPVLLETFVEKRRFQGTCYKAANWVYLARMFHKSVGQPEYPSRFIGNSQDNRKMVNIVTHSSPGIKKFSRKSARR